jgi:hypothetical protein
MTNLIATIISIIGFGILLAPFYIAFKIFKG